jgi:pyruvate/2-oxoglutarate/acetoin dehydrogenase E1 component
MAAEAATEKRPPRYIDGIRRALASEMERDEDVVVMGVDVGAGGGVYGATKGLYDRFGAERVIDSPIAEAGLLGAAVGAAMAGLRPVAEIMYMDFLTVCLDPIVNQAAKLRYMTGGGVEIPIVFRTQTGGGRSSGAQHSQSLEGVVAHVPGLKVYLPSNARDVEDLLSAAIRDDGPVVFVENRRLYNRPDPDYERDSLPPGVARVVREGSDLTLIAWGRMVEEAARACEEELADLSVELVDMRTLVPLDLETAAASVARTGRALVVHEAVEAFGPGAEIAMRLTERLLYEIEGPIRRLGAVTAPTPYSPPLEEAALPGAATIATAARELLTI